MKKCPSCQVDLTGVDVSQGTCPECGASLDDIAATAGDAGQVAADEVEPKDEADRRTIASSDTRKEVEDSRKTISEDDERQTVDDPKVAEEAAAEDESSKTVADVTNTVEIPSDDQSDLGQTIEEPVAPKDKSSKTVSDISQTVDVSADSQQELGQTIVDSVPADDQTGSPAPGDLTQTVDDSQTASNTQKTVSDDAIGGQTIELNDNDEPVDPSKKTVPDGEIDQTVLLPDAASADDGPGTVDDVNFNATVDISGDEVASKPGTVTDKNAVATVDSTEVVSNIAEHVNKTWAGSIDEQDTPQTSLKTNVFEGETGTKSDLVIQPRQFGNANEPRKRDGVDYNLLELLGEGGMGMVYAARQASIDRTVAIKMLKPKTAQDEVQRCKFLAEAVVTGDLEHPNIVPIYDLGRNAQGALFYAMKRVQGTPWDQVIAKKSLHENIEILMKVADAVGFSHSRGIIHRDLKPENVMLGDFGEVLVMDWGLAIPTDNRLIGGLRPSTSMGGTPAYMAPEMATGPFERIGIHSDIYLLGAILFEVVSGKPPHTGKDVMKCLFAAAKNKIQEVDEDNELIDIALNAMSTDPAERHASVTEFQNAIREYLSHSESIVLSDHAEKDLAKASQTNDYQDYSRALFGFQQAIELWDGNEPAKDGLSLAQIAYATSARDKGDFDLGASLLDAEKADQVELLSEIREAKSEVEARKQRLKTTKRALMALAATVFFVVLGALGIVLNAQAETNRQKRIAEGERDKAVKAEKNAVEAKEEAVRAKDSALLAKKKEEEQRKKAEQLAIAEAKAKEEAVMAKNAAEKAALAEKEAKEEAVKAKDAALLAQKKEAEQREKAEQLAVAEAKAKEEAVMAKNAAEKAALAEKKAKDEAVKAKDAALLAQKKEAEQREKAEQLAVAEAKAKEEAVKAKDAALLAQKKEAEQREKAEQLAVAEAKAKEDAVMAKNDAEKAALAEKKAKEEAVKAKDAALLAQKKEAEQREKAEQLAVAEAKAKEEAVMAKDAAEKAALAEKKAKDEAVKAKDAALLARKKEEEQRKKAEEEERRARLAEAEAKRQAYVALISAAAAKIEENAFDSARDLLEKCDPPYRNWEWGRLWHLCNQSVEAMDARAQVAAIDYSPVDNYFATGSSDGKVRIWKLDAEMSSEPVRVIDTGREQVLALAYSPDGKRIAVGTGSEDGLLQIWNVATGTPVARIASGKRSDMLSSDAHTQEIVSVEFNAAGDLLLTSSFDSTAKVWDVSDPASPQVRRTLRGHTWWVWNARFSPDGQQILTVSDDGNAIVWTDRTGQWRHEANIKTSPKFRGHTGPIFAGAFSPDGQTVATAGYGQRVLLWRPANLKEFDHVTAVATFDPNRPSRASQFTDAEVLDGHTGPVRSLAFSSDGALLLTAGEDNTIRVWNISQRGKSVVLRGHGKAVQGCDVSPSGEWIVSGSLDGTARVWDLSRYEEQRVLRGKVLDAHEDAVLSAYFSSDGKQIVTASRDSTAKTWSLADQKLKDTFKEGHTLREGHLFRAARARFFADDKYLATSAVDNTVRIWDVARGTQVDLLENTGRNAALAVSRDGTLIVTGSGNRGGSDSGFYAQAWRWKKGEKVQRLFELGNHRKTVTQVAVSPDQQFIATGDANGHCNLWHADSGKLASPLSWHINGITALAFLPDSSRLLSADREGSIVQWDLKSYQPLKTLTIQLGRGVTAMDAAQLPSGNTRAAVICTDEGRVELYDVDRGSRGKIGPLDSNYRLGTPDDVQFSADGSRILLVASPDFETAEAVSSAATVHIFDSATGQEIDFKVSADERGPFLFLGRTGTISSAAFNSDGTRVVAVGGNRAQVWKVNSDLPQEERIVMSFRPHGPIATARFSPDGESIITGSWDTTIKIWDTETKQNELTLKDLHTRAVNSVRFSRDGSLALSASDDGTAKLWDAKTGEVQMIFGRQPGQPKDAADIGHTQGVTDAVFMPGEKQVATASRDGTVRIWNVTDGASVKTLRIPDAQATELNCVSVSHDGRWIVAGGEKDANFWDLTTGTLVATLSGHTAPITSVEFSGEVDQSRRLLTGSEDFTAKVWDTSKLWEEPGELAAAEADAEKEVTEIMTLKGHTRAVTSVTFSPNGQYCLTGSHDGTAIVWLTSPWRDDDLATAAK